MAEKGTLLGEVQRGFRRFWGTRWFIKWPIIVFAGLILLAIVVPSSDDEDDGDQAAAVADKTAEPTRAGDGAKPTELPKPTDAPSPTNTPRPPTNTPTPPPPTATSTPILKPRIGVTIEAKGSRYTVNAIEDNVPSTNQFLKPDPGNRWLAIDVTQEGVSPEDPFNPLYFALQDSEDYVHDEMAFGGKEPDFGSGNLATGQRVRGWVTFEIPANAQVVTVLVQPEPLGGRIVIADLSE